MQRYYFIALTLLLGVAASFAQQPGSNVVPKEALNGAILRALNSPTLPPLTTTPRLFRAAPPVEKFASACAVRLLETPGTPTNDKMAYPGPSPAIDPHMAVAPPIPACPENPAPPAKP
jgi:hypothetical protein